MIEQVIQALAWLIIELIHAGADKARQEEALMRAEEVIAQARARSKFG